MQPNESRHGFGLVIGVALELAAIGLTGVTLTSDPPHPYPWLRTIAAALASVGVVVLAVQWLRNRSALTTVFALLSAITAAEMWWGAFD